MLCSNKCCRRLQFFEILIFSFVDFWNLCSEWQDILGLCENKRKNKPAKYGLIQNTKLDIHKTNWALQIWQSSWDIAEKVTLTLSVKQVWWFWDSQLTHHANSTLRPNLPELSASQKPGLHFSQTRHLIQLKDHVDKSWLPNCGMLSEKLS